MALKITQKQKKTLLLRMRFYYTLFLLALCACGKQAHEVGGLAPDFTLKDTAGKMQTFSQHKGKVILLHFWTDFCKSCKVEFPKLQEVYEALQGNDFELLAVNLGQEASVSQKFQQDYEATFPMWTDTKNIMKDLYHINVYPTNVFINPEGKIVRIIRGWVDKKQVAVLIAQNKK